MYFDKYLIFLATDSAFEGTSIAKYFQCLYHLHRSSSIWSPLWFTSVPSQ